MDNFFLGGGGGVRKEKKLNFEFCLYLNPVIANLIINSISNSKNTPENRNILLKYCSHLGYNKQFYTITFMYTCIYFVIRGLRQTLLMVFLIYIIAHGHLLVIRIY